MIPNKLAYFSQGSTYRTYKEEEDVSENTISFVGDDLSVATQGKIFGVRGVYPGTCTTAAGTAAKVATTTPLFPLDSSGKPLPGTTIAIKFSNTNTYKTAGTTMTLNVNSTGAYPIYYNNAEVVSTTSANTAACGYKNRYTFYIFNGTQWVWLSYGTDTNTTYSNASLGQGYAIQNNESENDTVTATLSSYALTTGGIVVVKFIFDVPCVSNPTLNVNEEGQRYIYHNGSPLGPGIIKSGDLATFIYSTNYYLISLDRDFNDPVSVGTLNTNNSTAQTVNSSESFSSSINLHKISKTGSYNDLLNKPTIPTIGTLNTNNSTAQTASSSESFSGNISLHKVSKTGSYTDLNNIPIVILDSVTTVYEAIPSNIGKKFFTTGAGRDNVVEIISDGFGATSATHIPSNNVIYYVIDVNKFYRYKLNSTFSNGQMVEIGGTDISGKADLNGNEEELFTANGLYVTAWTDYTKGINIDDNYNSTTQKNTLELTDGTGTLSYTFGNTSEVIATRSDLNNLGTVTSTAITNLTDIL